MLARLEPRTTRQKSSFVTELAVHPCLPQVAAGTSDGLVTVYDVSGLVRAAGASELLAFTISNEFTFGAR